MGSTTPWLEVGFQHVQYVITNRVVNETPVWAAESANSGQRMYRANDGQMFVDHESDCAQGNPGDWIRNIAQNQGALTPTQLPLDKWASSQSATLGAQFSSAPRTSVVDGTMFGSQFIYVPSMRVTAVHGLDDGHPAMAAALRQLAALTDGV